MQKPATYTYDVSVPAAAIPLFDGPVVNYWEGSINGVFTNINNHPVRTQINFNPIAAGGDILIVFDTNYPVMKPNPVPGQPPIPGTQDFPSPGSIQPDGTWPGNPGNPGGGPGGGSEGVLAFWTPALKQLTFNSFVNWYYDDPMVAPANGQFDFITTALHEFGHILGLDHEGAAGTVMYGTQANYGMVGIPTNNTSVVRVLDAGTRTGSVILYTIAITEPTSMTTVAIALMCLTALRRQRRPT